MGFLKAAAGREQSFVRLSAVMNTRIAWARRNCPMHGEIFARAMAAERTLGGDAPQGSPTRCNARMQLGRCSADGVCGAAVSVNNATRRVNQEA
jgi:hypothetical protein